VDTKDIALTSVFSALYATLVIALAPISYGPLQLRVADAIIPLAMAFGWPVVAGATMGCFVGNFYGQLGVLDYILGPMANLLAGTVVYLLRSRPLLASSIGALPIGIIVGSYLWTFFPPPEVFALPEWLAMIVSITLSTLIVMGLLGYILYKSVCRMLGPLKPR
jgi:hypothetical protein